MGLFGALNPFTFGRKYKAAWNALMAAYTFDHLSAEQRELVMDKSLEIDSSTMHRPITFLEFTVDHSVAEQHYFYSLAMMNLGIVPALGTELWFEVKNPYTELLNAEDVIRSTRQQLMKTYGVEFSRLGT